MVIFTAEKGKKQPPPPTSSDGSDGSEPDEPPRKKSMFPFYFMSDTAVTMLKYYKSRITWPMRLICAIRSDEISFVLYSLNNNNLNWKWHSRMINFFYPWCSISCLLWSWIVSSSSSHVLCTQYLSRICGAVSCNLPDRAPHLYTIPAPFVIKAKAHVECLFGSVYFGTSYIVSYPSQEKCSAPTRRRASS